MQPFFFVFMYLSTTYKSIFPISTTLKHDHLFYNRLFIIIQKYVRPNATYQKCAKGVPEPTSGVASCQVKKTVPTQSRKCILYLYPKHGPLCDPDLGQIPKSADNPLDWYSGLKPVSHVATFPVATFT